MSARLDTTSRQLGEQGSALMVGLVIMVLGSIVIGAMMTMLDWSGERGKTRTDRAQNVAVVDRSLAAYEFALESNLTNEFHQFRLDAPAMNRLRASEASAAMGSATVVANSSFGADFRSRGLERTWMGGAGYELSMQHTLPDGRTSWWQLVNVIPPGGQNASLVAYMRTWIATGGPGSRVVAEPRIARAELRPGRFSDYQMLVDGPIIVSGGTDIRGRIHTNGYPDAYLIDAFSNADSPLVLGNALGSPQCFAGSGFSTARGRIVGSCTGFAAPRDEANDRFIDLLRGGEHLKLMKSMCGTMVFCPGGTGPWNIDLSSNSVNGSGIPGAAKAVYVEGEATLRGQTTRQITIGVAGRPGSYGAFGSASLSLRGGAVGSTGAGIVGLVVEGDIVPRIDLGDCVHTLNAAAISTSGSLTIPAQYRVPVAPSGSTPTCPKFTLNGSLGAHYAPLLVLAWGAQQAGYGARDLRYDTRLRTTPPPFFPLTGPWQVSSWKDAMPECLTAAMRTEADCG